MSKFDEAIATFEAEFKKLKVTYDLKTLQKAAKACGPALYRADASKVSTSDQKELDRVKKNFAVKRLGVKDDEKLDKAIDAVKKTFGASNRNKYRAMFYYLLAKELKKTNKL